MRHFLTGPTYSEQALFTPGEGNFERIKTLCAPLWCRGWAAFGPHQIWALQGDFILPDDSIAQSPGSHPVSRMSGKDLARQTGWRDPEHLNICLDEANSISWKIKLPAKASNIQLLSSVIAADANGSRSSNNAPMVSEDTSWKLEVVEASNDKGSANWHPPRQEKSALSSLPIGLQHKLTQQFSPIQIPLTAYAGRELIVTLRGAHLASGEPSVFLYPHLVVDIEKTTHTADAASKLLILPDNTNLSDRFPKFTPDDIVFNAIKKEVWKAEGLHLLDSANETIICQLDKTSIPAFTLLPGISIRAHDFTNVAVEMAASAEVRPRVICLQLVIDSTKLINVLIPMLPDTAMHYYSYD